MSNISYSWPVQFVGNGESLKTVVNKYCKSNTSQKYILNRIADSPFVYDGTTIITGSLTLDYSFGYWNNHPLYTLISDNHVYTGTINMSEWKVDTIVCHATKSDLNKNGAQIGSLLKVYHGESSDKQNKVTLTTSATHMCGFLIIDQNNQTDVYVIGVNSGVTTLCKTSAENTPVISKNSSGCTLEIPLKTWSSFVFLSFYSCNISTTLM